MLKKNFSENTISSSGFDEKYLPTNTNFETSKDNNFNEEEISHSQFLEIAPLDYEIDNLPQKDGFYSYFRSGFAQCGVYGCR